MRAGNPRAPYHFYSHVNYSVTKIAYKNKDIDINFYSHVNYSVTKMLKLASAEHTNFYSHVNYSVTKIPLSYILQ